MTDTTIATLGDLKRDFKLHVHCMATLCFHNVPLDVTELRMQLGPGFPLCDLARRCRCTKCGGRQIKVIMSPVRTGPGC